jgi:hypothetical protein
MNVIFIIHQVNMPAAPARNLPMGATGIHGIAIIVIQNESEKH